MLSELLRIIAMLAAAFFAGGALYITVVEHPRRMAGEVGAALVEFAPMYARAAPWQAANAAVALVAGLLWGVAAGGAMAVLGALLVGLVIPITLVLIAPTNRLLMATTPPDEAEARDLLARWGRLHGLRSLLGVIGLLLLVLA